MMKNFTTIVLGCFLSLVNIHSQELLPESQKHDKDFIYQMGDYAYKCNFLERAKVTFLYNNENRWFNTDNIYKATGKVYFYDGTEETNNIVDDQQMINLAYSIIDNAFTRSTANQFESYVLGIVMYLDSNTGKVSEVSFRFSPFVPYARIPISVYRDIELKLKEQISFTTTDVGKQLNYIMLSWNQRPKGALPPITPIE